jgi:hypothetical protein
MDFELDILGDLEGNITEDTLVRDLSLKDVTPISIKGYLDDFDGDMDIEFSNGDRINYHYNYSPASCTASMSINNINVEVDRDFGFIYNIISNYKYYLKSKVTNLLPCIKALNEWRSYAINTYGSDSESAKLAEDGLKDISNMMSLIDGAYNPVELFIYNSESEYNKNEWGPKWMEGARKYGASPD